MFASMHSSVGKLSDILITARHLVNFAPSETYSLHLSSSPSSPWVTVSSGEDSNGARPLSTLIPGKAPWFLINSTNDVPSSALCLIVSSNKITPPILSCIPLALKSISL